MYLHYKFGYTESLDFTQLPGYERLTDDQKQKLRDVYTSAYNEAYHLGQKVALGKAHEDARLAFAEALKPVPTLKEVLPRSIFYGLNNCQ